MSTSNVPQTRRAVNQRTAASEAVLEANEIHADLGTPCALVEQQGPWISDQERQLLDTLPERRLTMALSAYNPTKPCPACGNPVPQSEKEGRTRDYCNDACKMRYHRRIKAQCLWCKHDSTLPNHAYAGQTTTCWHCNATMRYTRDPKTGKVQWILTKNGKKNLHAPAHVTK